MAYSKKNHRSVTNLPIVKFNGDYWTASLSRVYVQSEEIYENTLELHDSEALDYFEDDKSSYRPEAECAIVIELWNNDIDDESPVGQYGFTDDEMEAAAFLYANSGDVTYRLINEEAETWLLLEITKLYRKVAKKLAEQLKEQEKAQE